jgi:flagellin-specific chaperone FliS
MSYELFEKAAAVNGEFEKIPSKTSILAKGISIDKSGYIQYKGQTYITNIVKLADLPTELKILFIENKFPAQTNTKENKEIEEDKNDNFNNLNKILFEQLQNIVDPEKGTDINQELKKANTVCNIADKIINIADLTLKAQIFHDKKRFRSSKSLY